MRQSAAVSGVRDLEALAGLHQDGITSFLSWLKSLKSACLLVALALAGRHAIGMASASRPARAVAGVSCSCPWLADALPGGIEPPGSALYAAVCRIERHTAAKKPRVFKGLRGMLRRRLCAALRLHRDGARTDQASGGVGIVVWPC